ncbi:MAG: BON domain-containing protein [Chloroflexi bacterium]|nr:BON domain-containing protein [Chloroflexota bacterium]
MTTHTPPQKLTRADQQILDDVRDAIYSIEIVRTAHMPIEIQVADGIVTIEGIVQSNPMKQSILVAAASTRNVKKVIDKLIDDTHLELAVAQSLTEAENLNDDMILVTAYKGVVTLSGRVDEEGEDALAEKIATDTPGVRSVINNLECC